MYLDLSPALHALLKGTRHEVLGLLSRRKIGARVGRWRCVDGRCLGLGWSWQYAVAPPCLSQHSGETGGEQESVSIVVGITAQIAAPRSVGGY